MKKFTRLLLGLILIILTAIYVPQFAGQLFESTKGITFQTQTIDILRAGEEPMQYYVEIARSPAEHALGLMNRNQVPEGTGMLFLFPEPQEASFWMKNTLVPLDMIFIDEGGQIVRIAEKTRPLDLTPIPSQGPVKAVLEIGGGEAEKRGLRVGDKVQLPE